MDFLEQAAVNPPPVVNFGSAEHPDSTEGLAGSTAVSIKSTPEWAEIKREDFPEMHLLTDFQCRQVNEVLLKVYASMNRMLPELPQELPPKSLYWILTSNWDCLADGLPAQQLKVSFSTVGNEKSTGEVISHNNKGGVESGLPLQYNEVIPIIAQVLEAGFVCFLNPETLEIEQVPGKMLDNPELFYASTRISERQQSYYHLTWNDSLMFEPLSEQAMVKILKDFVQLLTNHAFREKMSAAMIGQKSFTKIIAMINKSKHSADWKIFKIRWIEMHVQERLKAGLN